MKSPSHSPLKLPRAVEAHARHPELEELLARELRPLWSGGTVRVAQVPLTPAFEKTLIEILRYKKLERGLERIDQLLASEQKGLQALQKKQGTAPANRVSRIFLLANDGAERFYRSCESTLLQHGDRVLALRLDADSERLGLQLFGPEKPVKALLVADRDAVTHLLLSLLEP